MNYKTIELLKNFSKEEIISFNKFLHSPFYNKSKKANVLFENLLKFYPKFDSRKFNKANLYKAIYGTSIYNDSTLRNLFADLHNLQLKFLGIYKIEEDLKFDLLNRQTEQLINKNLSGEISDSIERIDNEINSLKNINSEDFLVVYKSDIMRYNAGITNIKFSNTKNIKTIFRNIERCADSIEIYFILENLKIWNIKFNLAKKSSDSAVKHNKFLSSINFKEIEKKLASFPENFRRYFTVYSKIYLAFNNFNEVKYFEDLKRTFYANINILEVYERFFIMGLMLDYCVIMKKEYSENKFFFENELFELYKITINEKLYKSPVNSFIPVDLFRNILIHAVKLGMIEWAENFLKNYKSELQVQYKNDLTFFGNAILEFEKQNYQEVLNNINEINFDYFPLKLDIKSLLLKTYYCLDYTENIEAHLNSYKQFLYNIVSISKTKKKLHQNFIRTIRHLYYYKFSKDKVLLEELQNFINTNSVLEKDWLNIEINKLLIGK